GWAGSWVLAGRCGARGMAMPATPARPSPGLYSAEQVGGALADYFRAANLQALSELGRAWMAGTIEAVGEELLARRGLAEPTAQMVVVAGGSGSGWGELGIRRAAELARAADAQLPGGHGPIVDAPAPPPT